MTLTLRAQVDLLTEQNTQLKDSLNDRRERSREQRTQIHDLVKKLDRRDAVINDLENQNTTSEKLVEELKTQATQLNTEIDGLKQSQNKAWADLTKARALTDHLRKALALDAAQREENENGGGDPQDIGDMANDGGNDDPQNEDEQSEDENELPDAMYDPKDDVYRCVECGTEVVDGTCQGCWTKYDWTEEMGIDTIPTQNESLAQDRQLSPRGTTPLREIGIVDIPRDYRHRLEEYKELLSRGATRTMCETFFMEFTPQTGIIGWADAMLYDTFAGPAMQKGDFWKIHLGRRIDLDEDDLDGAHFIEGLLEDALLFPLRSDLSKRMHERWETVEETPGIWVTRPMASELVVEVEDNSDDQDLNGSDDDQYGDDESEAGIKIGLQGWVTKPSGAIRVDAYTTETDSEGDDEQIEDSKSGAKAEEQEQDIDDIDVQMSDPGWCFHPREADAAWPTIIQENESEEEQNDDGDPKAAGDKQDAVGDKDSEAYGNMAVDDFDVSSESADSDSADSDFDSDEALSGDEVI